MRPVVGLSVLPVRIGGLPCCSAVDAAEVGCIAYMFALWLLACLRMSETEAC